MVHESKGNVRLKLRLIIYKSWASADFNPIEMKKSELCSLRTPLTWKQGKARISGFRTCYTNILVPWSFWPAPRIQANEIQGRYFNTTIFWRIIKDDIDSYWVI